jgi:chromosomal replication initiation ATPase DnaA
VQVIEEIKKAVCLEFGLCRFEIESHQRRRSVAVARMVAMSLAKRMTDLSLTRVGHMFGNHSRWAVNYACKRVDPYVVIVAQTLPAKAAPQDWVKALQAMMELSR